jgi:hypothetical protein
MELFAVRHAFELEGLQSQPNLLCYWSMLLAIVKRYSSRQALRFRICMSTWYSSPNIEEKKGI